MKSKPKVAIAMFMCFLVIGCGTQITGEATKEEPIKVGFIGPLTVLAVVGEELRNGVDLALDEIDDSRIQVIFEDGQCMPKAAVSAAQKLMTVDKVKVIIGPACTSSILPVAPLANQNKVPIIGTIDSSEDIGEAGPFVFSTGFSVEGGAKLMAHFAYEELGARTASALYDTDDWAKTLAESFKAEFESLGGDVIEVMHHDIESQDYRTELIKMKAQDPDVIYAIPLTLDGIILRQAKELGIDKQILGADSLGIETVLEGTGNAAEGIFFSYQMPYDEATEKRLATLKQKYIAKYGKEPFNMLYVGLAYDNMMMVADILKTAKTSEEIRDALASMPAREGIIGTIEFDDRGLANRKQFINTVKDGKFQAVKT